MEEEHEKDLIKLSLINGKAFTFIPGDYLKIRSEYHIVGNLIGIPIVNARNLHVNGLPAILNEYEVKLMIEKGLAVLEDKPGLKEPPDNDTKKMYEEYQRNVIVELHKPYIESRLESTKLNMEQIIKGKTKKLIKSGIPESEIVINPEDIIEAEMTKITNAISSKNVFVQVPTQHPFAVSSNIISDVSVDNERNYKVFKDLWSKGFYITTGDSFGCDFLTYPGDPFNFHASQTINVVDPHKPYDFKFLVSSARLSISVKKKCVFAYTNDDDDSVTYQTLQWDNPRLKDLYPAQPGSSQSQDNEEFHATS